MIEANLSGAFFLDTPNTVHLSCAAKPLKMKLYKAKQSCGQVSKSCARIDETFRIHFRAFNKVIVHRKTVQSHQVVLTLFKIGPLHWFQVAGAVESSKLQVAAIFAHAETEHPFLNDSFIVHHIVDRSKEVIATAARHSQNAIRFLRIKIICFLLHAPKGVFKIV